MALPDPADHRPDCPTVDTGQPPHLHVRFDASKDASSVNVMLWESCSHCHEVVWFDSERMPWRRFHRQWRASLAVYVATWEHRHNLGGRVTGRS